MPRSRDQPVLAFEGARGSGKTALINSLAKQLDQGVPYARLDFEANRQATVPEVLSALAFELSRRCARYPQLKFPRLLTGLVVMDEDLNLGNRGQARAQVTKMLEQQRSIDRLRHVLKGVAADVAVIVQQQTGMPVETLVGDLPDVVLDGAGKWPWSRRLVLGSFHNWYGHRGRGFTNDAIDVLVDLNRWARNAADPNAEDDQRRIDELLLDAFLADLRAEVARARHVNELTANCIVLLDNADIGLSQDFLRELVSARRLRAAEHRLDPEPLTVVTTSRGPLLADIPPTEVFESSGNAHQANELLEQEGGDRQRWFRYRLPDLSKDEVGAMVAALALRQGNNHRLTALIWQLSCGHPAATRLLLDAVAKRPENCDELARVLAQQEPEDRANRLLVAERLLSDVLGDFPQESTTDLITCASAATREHAVRLATSDDQLADGTPLLTGTEARYLAIVYPVLWPASAGAGPALLRRLLLGKLAQRCTEVKRHGTRGREPEWVEVFGWHRDRCMDAKDQTHELYYALANGDLAFVAPILLQRLKEDPAASWLELLLSVTRAPYRPHYVAAPEDAPIDEVFTLTGDTTGLPRSLASVTRLTAAMQILASPLTGSRRRNVHWQVAAEYTDLARLSSSGRELLFGEARAHTREADGWN